MLFSLTNSLSLIDPFLRSSKLILGRESKESNFNFCLICDDFLVLSIELKLIGSALIFFTIFLVFLQYQFCFLDYRIVFYQ